MQGVVDGNRHLSNDRFRLGQRFVAGLLLGFDIQALKAQFRRQLFLHSSDFRVRKGTRQIELSAA